MSARIFAALALLALAAALPGPAAAGFWGDMKQSLGTAADNARKDGAAAADAVGEAALDAAGYVTGKPQHGGGAGARKAAAETSPEPAPKPEPAN